MNFTINNPNFRFTNTTNRGNVTTRIILHHVAGRMTAAQVHDFHQRPESQGGRGWAGTGYHFHIDFDGRITQGRDMRHVGAHTVGQNNVSIGIVLNGNFQRGARNARGQYIALDKVTDAQFNALIWLIGYIREVYGDLAILPHSDFANTNCPGNTFPLDEVRRGQFRGTVTTPNPAPPTPQQIEKGTTVDIAAGATWWGGQAVPAWVLQQSWVVKSIRGDRAVLGRNLGGTNNINSPIHVKFLTVAIAAMKPYKVQIRVPALNIRRGPGTNHNVVDVIHSRGTYTIVGEANGIGASRWGRLKSGKGWISLDHVVRR